jgi:hypothetical protein
MVARTVQVAVSPVSTVPESHNQQPLFAGFGGIMELAVYCPHSKVPLLEM